MAPEGEHSLRSPRDPPEHPLISSEISLTTLCNVFTIFSLSSRLPQGQVTDR